MSEAKANELLLRRFIEEVWNRKNESAIDEMLTEDSVCYGLPDPDAVARGIDGFKSVFRMFCGAFPDIHIAVEEVIASGDRVAARWQSLGTHLGDHLGFPATGKAIPLNGATICVVRDGRILEGWNLMDLGHLFDMLRGGTPRAE